MNETKSTEGFLLGDRNVGPILSAFSYGTSYFSAVIFVGYAGMFGYMIGIGSIWIGIGNAIIGCLLSWIVLAKKTRSITHKLKTKTMPEFFAARYGSKTMKIYAAIIIFIFLVPYAASVYKGLGSLFSMIFNGANPVICMAIVAGLTCIYLLLGGYIATAKNDVFQGMIMIIGLIFMLIIIFSRPEVGGINGLFSKLSKIGDQFISPFGGNFIKLLCINILLTSFGVWGLPQMIHKYYAIKDERSIKTATIVSTIFALFIGVGAYLTGSVSRLFIPSKDNDLPDLKGGYDDVMPTILMKTLTNNVFTIIILGIIVILLLSASMSTLSALVLSSSSSITIDLLKEAKKNITEKNEILAMRFFCFIFIALSFIFASLNISFIVNLMSFSWGIVAGSFIGPFLWGLYKKNISKIGGWAGLLSGPVIVFSLLIYNMQTLPGGFEAAKSMAPEFGVIAMIVSVIVTPLFGLVGKKKD
jgi:SSS family solute:Na+ symporter/sodium/proline symporter